MTWLWYIGMVVVDVGCMLVILRIDRFMLLWVWVLWYVIRLLWVLIYGVFVVCAARIIWLGMVVFAIVMGANRFLYMIDLF